MQHDDNTTRRTVLAVAAGGAAVAASGAARAQQPRAKGPLVWLDMDQQALDDAYDQVVYAPNREQVAKRRDRQQRQGARGHRRARAPRLRAERDREARHLPHQAGERAGEHLHPRRRMARQPRRRLRVPGRAVREGGRALRHPRLHQCRRRRRQPVPDDRAGAARGRLGLQERRELRRRSEPALSELGIPPAPISAAAW